MPTHQYSIYQIAVWILHWQIQHIRYWVPYIGPYPENAGPPEWWYHYYSDWDWWRLIGAGNVPYASLINMAVRGAWMLLGLWVDEVGDWAVSSVQDTIRGWVGYAAAGFATFSDWISGISGLIGTYVPWWCTNLTNAADKLYDWLPTDIRANLVTWHTKFSAWYNASISWVQTNYDQAKASALLAYAWIADTGSTLNSWYSGAHTWLDDFRLNAAARVVEYLGDAWAWLEDFSANYYARITGWLGVPWNQLVAFTGGALTFFYNLWGWYAAEIGAFWADPLLWLYDRVEDELVRRW